MRDRLRKARKLKTGEIAAYCGVTFRTVIRWIERGELQAFQLPGRGDNRITVEDFLAFLKRNRMPIPEEFQDSSHRVLIVEDDSLMAKGMEKALQKRGFEVRVVSNGFMAGSALHAFAPAVMILDLNMPGVDGFSVLEFLRKNPSLPAVRVLVVSASSNEELQRALGAGAHDVLQKPFGHQDLIEKTTRLAGIEGTRSTTNRSSRDTN